MTWKSTAVVSGLGLLATWVTTSVPPVAVTHAPQPQTLNAPARATTTATDIQREADRLQVKLHPEPSYAEPSRNLFRFGAKAASTRAAVVPVPQHVDPPRVTAAPVALHITLAGIAGDTVDGKEQRTAVLSTPTGVLIVREGDEVAGQFRVVAIESEAVQLVRLDDGGVLRLSLKP